MRKGKHSWYPGSQAIERYAILDEAAVCRLLGGSRSLNPSALYQGIKLGRYPKPIKVGGSSRWLREECELALQAMVGRRGS
jgi:predicted DNA-binding transcriptional regulator AlpA